MQEYLILFDHEKCTQCHGCEIACKVWRDLPYGVRYRRVINLWQGSYPVVKSQSLSLACLHCADPACAAACSAEAISKGKEDGRVLVDASLCVGCRACAEACPFGVPQFGEDEVMQKCDLCLDHTVAGIDPPCVETCLERALILTKVTWEEKKAIETTIAQFSAQFLCPR